MQDAAFQRSMLIQRERARIQALRIQAERMRRMAQLAALREHTRMLSTVNKVNHHGTYRYW
jgi:hypothetical protein